MSHSYPLAISAIAAVETAEYAALGRAEAARLADGVEISGLETEWLTLPQDEAEALMSVAEAGIGEGFVQYYENADGTPVLAVTYWKLVDAEEAKAETEPELPPKPAPQEDHTDDLYFLSGRTKKRRKKKKTDPNQMDLFGTPRQE